ncbi:MAG: ATP-binding cassette domain-containing protein [Anaerolineales bacterium]|nr:ATP-binding cassette domain-containing protein [Anaerolineales bacterium]
MISIRHLHKSYQGSVHALCDLNLDITGSGMFGLLGVNGAGKTTLMRILAGLLAPTRGSVHVFDNNLANAEGRHSVKSLLGYLPQELGLYPELTAREFLDYIATLKGVTDRAEREQQVIETLQLARLVENANRRLKTYSGGMKQRVGIAQALLGSPRLLIVDEPTAGLDPEERVRFRNLLARVAQRCTVILSTHIVEDIDQSCNDLAVLYQGEILFRGSPAELINQVRGKVWTILDDPTDDLILVSTHQLPDAIQYRVLGEPVRHYSASPVEPRLEDAYLWLMNHTRSAVN